MDVPLPPVDAPIPSTSHLPSRYQEMEISLSEVGPSLFHMSNSEIQQQQVEETEIAKAERYEEPLSPTPPHSPTPPVELETFRTQEDEFGRFRVYS